MSVQVHLKHLHISPRKVRLVADLVRGEKVKNADDILFNTSKKSTEPIRKLLKSAVATAKNDYSFEEDNLLISKIIVNEGPTLKRWRPRAHGRAFPIMKRTSHICIELEEIVKGKGKQNKKGKKEDKKLDVKKIDELDVNAEDVKSKKPTNIDKSRNDIVKDRTTDKGQQGILKKVFRRKSG